MAAFQGQLTTSEIALAAATVGPLLVRSRLCARSDDTAIATARPSWVHFAATSGVCAALAVAGLEISSILIIELAHHATPKLLLATSAGSGERAARRESTRGEGSRESAAGSLGAAEAAKATLLATSARSRERAALLSLSRLDVRVGAALLAAEAAEAAGTGSGERATRGESARERAARSVVAAVSTESGAGSLLTALTEATERAGGGREAAGSTAGGRSASGLAALLAGLAGLLLGDGGGGHKGAEVGVSGKIGRVWKGERLTSRREQR